MKAFKGFNKDMTCRGFQYEKGKTYETDEARLCETGFHACERPLDCFSYYAPGSSVYREVELDDVSEERESDNSKIVGKRIKIGAELDIAGLCKAQFQYVKEHTTFEYTDPERATAGYRGAATAGNCGAATAGDSGAATAGYRGAATAGDSGAATAGDSGAATAGDSGAATSRGCSAVGKNGIACARGNNVKVMGDIGALLVIAEEKTNSYDIDCWKVFVVDGEKIKANTLYGLRDSELVELKE